MKTAVGIGAMAIGYMLIYASVKFGPGGKFVKNPWLVWKLGGKDGFISAEGEEDLGAVNTSDLFIGGGNDA